MLIIHNLDWAGFYIQKSKQPMQLGRALTKAGDQLHKFFLFWSLMYSQVKALIHSETCSVESTSLFPCAPDIYWIQSSKALK